MSWSAASAGEETIGLAVSPDGGRPRRRPRRRRAAPRGTRCRRGPRGPASPTSSPALDLEVDRLAVGPEPEPADAQHGRPLRSRRAQSSSRPALASASEPVIRRTSCCDVQPPRSSVATVFAGAHHRDAVADLLDLVHAVGDEDDADALRRESADDREQAVAGGDVERRRGLVEDQDPRVAQQRPHDAAGLAVGQRQLLDGDPEVERSPPSSSSSVSPRPGALLARRNPLCARCRRCRARRCRAPTAPRRPGPPGRR